MTSLNAKKLLAAIDWASPDKDSVKYSGYFYGADFTKAAEVAYLNVFEGDKGYSLNEEDIFEVTNRLISLYQEAGYNFQSSFKSFLQRKDNEVCYQSSSDPLFKLDESIKPRIREDITELRSKFQGSSSLSYKLADAKAFSEFFFACLESNGTFYKSNKGASHKAKIKKMPRLKTAGKTKLS